MNKKKIGRSAKRSTTVKGIASLKVVFIGARFCKRAKGCRGLIVIGETHADLAVYIIKTICVKTINSSFSPRSFAKEGGKKKMNTLKSTDIIKAAWDTNDLDMREVGFDLRETETGCSLFREKDIAVNPVINKLWRFLPLIGVEPYHSPGIIFTLSSFKIRLDLNELSIQNQDSIINLTSGVRRDKTKLREKLTLASLSVSSNLNWNNSLLSYFKVGRGFGGGLDGCYKMSLIYKDRTSAISFDEKKNWLSSIGLSGKDSRALLLEEADKALKVCHELMAPFIKLLTFLEIGIKTDISILPNLIALLKEYK